jgi:hypothetical protein
MFMRSIKVLFLFITLVSTSCGRNLPTPQRPQNIIANSAVSVSPAGSSSSSANLSDTGMLTVPSIPVSQGGYFTLSTGGTAYVVRTQSSNVKSVLKSLFDDQANLGGNQSIQYRVRFVGTTSIATCTGSSSGKCRIITLSSIQAY